MQSLERYVRISGRIFFSFIFLVSAFGKLASWSATVGYMASKGIPLTAFFMLMACLCEISGGFSILFAYKSKLGALILLIFLIPTTLIFHNFWSYQGMEQQNQMVHFMKNLSIMGALFIFVSLPSAALKSR